MILFFVFFYQYKNKKHSFKKEGDLIVFYEEDVNFKSYPEKTDENQNIATVYDVIDGKKKK